MIIFGYTGLNKNVTPVIFTHVSAARAAARQSELCVCGRTVFPTWQHGARTPSRGAAGPPHASSARPALDLRFRERQVDANTETTVGTSVMHFFT